MNRKFKTIVQKITAGLSALSLVAQSILPAVPAFAKPATHVFASGESTTISLNGSNEFVLAANADGTVPVSYNVEYITNTSVTEGIVGTGTTDMLETEYAGTCSGSICTPHTVVRGVYKALINTWCTSKWFSVSAGTLTVTHEVSCTDTVLTAAEDAWVDAGTLPVTPTPTPTPTLIPTPTPTPTPSPSGPPAGCYTDSGGVNDEPGQKDLTKMCLSYTNFPPVIDVSWNWDEIGWTGNNTGDSCSLFDSDGDGFTNYSICVSVQNTPATYLSTTLYSCSDQKSDRCTNPSVTGITNGTTCNASVQSDDPFPAGTDNPNDTVATCAVNALDVGGLGTISLLDGCTYPSQQPNSDPSDCVLASTANQVGALEVIKQVVPTTDSGLFNLGIDANTYVVNVGDDGATGEKVVSTGNHTVFETAGTGTTLANYDTAIVCRGSNGTGAIVAQSTNTSSLVVNVGQNADIVCTITNTREQGTLTVNKVVVPASASGLFNLQIDGVTAGTGANVGNGGTTGAIPATPGAHLVGETAGTSTTLSDYTAAFSGDCDAQGNVTVASGASSVCTITNTLNPGSITVVKQTDPDGSLQSFDFTLSGSTSSATTLTDGGSHLFNNLLPGTFALAEASVSGWVNTSATCSDGSLPASINVSPGEAVTCTFTNTQNGHLIVSKVTDPATDTTTQFDITATGSSTITAPAERTITGGATVDYEVAPGTYTVTEATEAGWMQTGNTCSDVVVVAGGQAACTITNTELANVTVVKYEDANANGAMDSGETTLDGWEIWLSAMAQFTGAQVAGQVTFSDLNPGAYTLSEQLQESWYQSNIACDNEIAIDNDNSHAVTLAAGQDVTCYIGNYRNAHIIVTKDVVNPDGDPVTDTSTSFAFAVSGSTDAASLTDDQSHDYTVTPGLHTVTETTDPNYTFVSCSGGIASNTFAGTIVGVASGETVNVTCTNAQMKATITVVKNVVASDGTTDVADTNEFDVTVDGTTSPFAEGSSAVFSVNPGTYPATEAAETNYTELSNSGPATVGSGGEATITIVNQQNPGTISGYKLDASSQTGIAGWVINLYNCITDFNNCVLGATTTTDGTGFYSFTNLITGLYKVVEAAVVGWTPVGPTEYDVTITPGNVSANNTFTNFQNISISGKKFNDVNGNGTQDVGEPNLANWTINLGGSAAGSTTTASDGTYTFANLGPGTYTMTETQQPGWVQTTATPAPIIAVSGQNVSNVDFGNQAQGTITIVKNGIPDGTQDFSFSSDLGAFTLDDDADVTNPNTQTFTDVPAGTYFFAEEPTTGWRLTGLSCSETAQIDEEEGSVGVTVTAGSDITCTYTNTQDGDITVIKFNDRNGDGNQDQGEEVLPGWVMNLTGQDSQTTGSPSGSTVFDNLIPGTYGLSETQQEGWTQTAISCSNGDGSEITPIPTPTPTPGDGGGDNGGKMNICHYQESTSRWNAQQINVSAWATHQTHGNGSSFDFLYGGPVAQNGHPDPHTGDAWCADPENQPDANTTFLGIPKVTAQEQDGDEPTHAVDVAAGEHVICTVGNQQLSPALYIAKSNDTGGAAKAPGDAVTFTLTVTADATGSSVQDVHVEDLPAGGFTYRPGSWTASSSVRGDLKAATITTEPTYASPGTWTLGDMIAGEVVTLTYLTDIASDEQSGLYRDVAWANGTSVTDTEVLANDTTDVFVGTEVLVAQTETISTSVNVNREEKRDSTSSVLGASTSLPETGANLLWLAAAGILAAVGVTSISLAWAIDPARKKRRIHA